MGVYVPSSFEFNEGKGGTKMNEDEVRIILDQLRSKELSSYHVRRDDFLAFREILVAQKDFLDFRGNAQHNGDTIYTYEPGWTK